MKIYTFPCGHLRSNMYLVADPCLNAVVIDPIDDKILVSALKSTSLTLKGLFLTHGHFDHAEALTALTEHTFLPSFIHSQDTELLNDPYKNASFLISKPMYLGSCTDLIEDRQQIQIGELSVEVIHTPGHTRGSVCYRIEDALFSGDTLFAGGIGRCDLYGGDLLSMTRSLCRLSELDPSLKVYPGHGLSTTLQHEILSNPYLSH